MTDVHHHTVTCYCYVVHCDNEKSLHNILQEGCSLLFNQMPNMVYIQIVEIRNFWGFCSQQAIHKFIVLEILLVKLWLLSTGEQLHFKLQCLSLAIDDGKFQPYHVQLLRYLLKWSLSHWDHIIQIILYGHNIGLWYVHEQFWCIKHT